MNRSYGSEWWGGTSGRTEAQAQVAAQLQFAVPFNDPAVSPQASSSNAPRIIWVGPPPQQPVQDGFTVMEYSVKNQGLVSNQLTDYAHAVDFYVYPMTFDAFGADVLPTGKWHKWGTAAATTAASVHSSQWLGDNTVQPLPWYSRGWSITYCGAAVKWNVAGGGVVQDGRAQGNTFSSQPGGVLRHNNFALQ